MTGRLLSLASGVLPEFTPEQTIGAAIAAGWPGVGIWVEPATWTEATAREVRARADDAAMVILDVEVIWIQPGGENLDHRRIIDAGARIGARNVLVVSSEPDPDLTAAEFAALVDHAQGSGIGVSLEFGAFTEVRCLSAALDILRRAGRPTAGLLIDPLHLARTGGVPADLRDVDPARFAYAQFCDAPGMGPAPSDTAGIIEEALDRRLAPGEGELPLGALLEVLPSMTPLSIEVRSKAVREAWPDPADRARALLVSMRAMMEDGAAT